MTNIQAFSRQDRAPSPAELEFHEVKQLFFNVLPVFDAGQHCLATRFAHGNTDMSVQMSPEVIRPTQWLLVPNIRVADGLPLLVQTQRDGAALSERDLSSGWKNLLGKARFGHLPLFVVSDRHLSSRTENPHAGLPLYSVDVAALSGWSAAKKNSLRLIIEHRMRWLNTELTTRRAAHWLPAATQAVG